MPSDEMAEKAITLDEIQALFGASMPIEAGILIQRHNGTFSELRQKLAALSAVLTGAEAGFAFAIGQPVEKFTGEAIWHGIVVARYRTTRGKERYVVEVQPQGFQMIAVPDQLRAMDAAPPRPVRTSSSRRRPGTTHGFMVWDT